MFEMAAMMRAGAGASAGAVLRGGCPAVPRAGAVFGRVLPGPGGERAPGSPGLGARGQALPALARAEPGRLFHLED